MLTDGYGWSRSDTATDEAIRAGISAAARVIVAVCPAVSSRILTYAAVCWRMLAYADVC
jgi:hypothetical protein